MRLPLLAAAGMLAAAMGSLVLPARAELSGPVNPPPASFQGMQYVDAQGCLFLRAGFGARTVWVPMIDQNRKPICGMAPTLGGAARVAAAGPAPQPAPAPEPAPVAQAAPAPAPAARPAPVVPVAAPPPVAAPSMPSVKPAAVPPGRSYQAVPLGQTVATCANGAPVLERVVLRTGGSALVCTRGDGTLSGWQPPNFAAGPGVGAALGYVTATADNLRGARLAGAVAPAAAVAAAAIPTPPKGWKLAWDDDRLNPMRGVGTAAGQAAQDRVWSRTVPATLVDAPVAQAAAPTARVSTMSAPAAPAVAAAPVPQGQAPRYVQIGSFALAANASSARAQVQALGLPAAKGQMTRSGAVLQIVYAGPFASAEAAASALQALKAAGFRDAFIR